MNDLPAWVTDSPGFDSWLWHLPFVCTHADDTMAPTLLTVIHEHLERGVGYLVTVYAAGEHYPLTAEEIAEKRSRGGHLRGVDEPPPGRPLRRPFGPNKRGSVNTTCPDCHKTRRWTRDQWSTFLNNAEALRAEGQIDLAAIVGAARHDTE